MADDFFHQHGIELRLGEAVATIDRDARLVRDAEGHETHWDKLVLATGSYPFVPPILATISTGALSTALLTISTVSPPMPPRRRPEWLSAAACSGWRRLTP